jgi:aspartate aminotransferase-like enzyme
MQTYPIPMVPGPTCVPERVRAPYQIDFGSADMEEEFFELYGRTVADLQTIYGTSQSVVVLSGEGMLALWGALKSCLSPGDRVLAIATGVFGYGIADMARMINATVHTVGLAYDQTISATDLEAIEAAIAEVRPKMITMVHCETPSGTLNPIEAVGRLKQQYDVPLLYVDAVASLSGAPLETDRWGIDLCLGGSQKCLSAMPNLAFLTVSVRTWEIVNKVDYRGYDALKPFETALTDRYFPYTHNWHAVASLKAATGMVLEEGLSNAVARHESVAAYCREQVAELGLELLPAPGSAPSPTVTAVKVPQEISWPDLDQRLRQKGMVVAGSYGPLAGKVFRLGHMGSQADMALMQRAMAVLGSVL